MDPTPFPAPQKSGGNYFLGLGLGFIPLILFFIFFALLLTIHTPFVLNLLYVPLVLEIVVLITAIVFLFISNVRFTGYGLLTAALVSPVVAFLSCVVVVRFQSP
jgi:hypothetical protein